MLHLSFDLSHSDLSKVEFQGHGKGNGNKRGTIRYEEKQERVLESQDNE